MTGPSKADVWIVDLGGSRGHEQKKERPCIVWRDLDHVKMAIVIPCTTTPNAEKFPHTLMILPTAGNGLSEESVALIFQITTIDKKRFMKKLGELENTNIVEIAAIMKDMLRI